MPGFGLAKLYEPSPGDIFLDLEGDPFVGEGGLEYLFGYSFRGEDGQERYVGTWALSRAQERAAFEQFIDFVMERLNAYPDLHIYHFAPYEPGALKRLMGRYATREDELDRLLRGKRFVDLFAVVRQGIRASVESYSIKRLEPLYGYAREASLQDANRALFKVQAFLELGDAGGIADDERSVVEAYNRDDCRSTWQLRDWLETVRASAIADGEDIERPPLSEAEPSEAVSDWQLKIAALVGRLTPDVPDDPVRADSRAAGPLDSRPLPRLAPPRTESVLVGVFPPLRSGCRRSARRARGVERPHLRQDDGRDSQVADTSLSLSCRRRRNCGAAKLCMP